MAAKKSNQNQAGVRIKTSARLAPLSYVLGVVALVMGLAWQLSVIVTVDSTVMNLLRSALFGLTGKAYFVLPLLLIYVGAALIVNVYHGVSVRNICLITAISFSIFALLTIATFVSGQGGLMEYIGSYNSQRVVDEPTSFHSYIQRVYLWGSTGKLQLAGGGALGMLVAYPAYMLFGVAGGIAFDAVLLLTLLLILTRINVIAAFRRLSDAMEKRRIERLQSEKSAQERAPKETRAEPLVQALPMEELKKGQHVSISMTQENVSPAYGNEFVRPVSEIEDQKASSVPELPPEQSGFMRPAAPQIPPYFEPPKPRRAQTAMEDGFIPVNNGDLLYDEHFVLHPEENSWEADGRQQAPPEIEPPVQAAAPQKPLERLLNQREKYTKVVARGQASNAKPPQKAPPPAVKPNDLPPWEEDEIKPEEKPLELTDWQEQLQKKKSELENAKSTSRSSVVLPLIDRKPKQVFTDPAVSLSGERVSISGEQRPIREAQELRMDGTPIAPKIKQMEMPMAVDYTPPPIRLLTEGQFAVSNPETMSEDEQRASLIERTLGTFNVSAQVRQITHGPAVTRFALKIAEGIKVKQVIGVLDNISLEMGSDRVRVESPIPGTSFVGIEVPNKKVSAVTMREVLDSEEMRRNTSPLTVALGKDIAGKPILCDLSKMPHLLIAGATGSGKSVCINSIVCSLLYRASPAQVRLIMVDPKQVELQVYNGIPHLLIPVVSNPKKASTALNWVVQEMFERYSKFSAKGVRNLDGFNKKMAGTDEILPNIVVIIDEMADLMDACRKDVEESVRRLAALARAAGIYMVLATQRPSVDVITGVIKNNIPSRIAFTVSSGIDSRTIIDTVGAEKLMGRGDMLYQPTGVSKPTRVQGCFVSDEEVAAITSYIKDHYNTEYDPNIIEHMEAKEEPAEDPMNDDGGVESTEKTFDGLLQESIRMAVEDGQSSISMLQRRLSVGYARAGRLVDEMAKRGIISASEGSKPRKTLISREDYMQMLNDKEV